MTRSITNVFRALALRRSCEVPKLGDRVLCSQSSNDSSRCGTAAAVVAVIGIGSHGLSLVRCFSPHYKVIALDLCTEKIWNLRRDWDSLSNVEWTTDAARISSATHILITVSTPLAHREIDTTNLRQALRTVRKHAKPGSTVVIESSVAVGMTRELLSPIMEERCLKGGISPERGDPGRKSPQIQDIPKVVSGLDDVAAGSLQSIYGLYAPVFRTLVTTSSPEAAEMTKLYEDCQRVMAVSFANEMADACARLGINPYEVSEAAATKPFGYLPVHPGVGIGGRSMPVNPYYLFSNSSLPLLEAATKAAEARPAEIGNRLMENLLRRKPDLSSTRLARVLVVGLAFKPGASLTTNSPGLTLMYHLQSYWSVPCQWYDPLVDEERVQSYGKRLEDDGWTAESLEHFDLIVVAMKQREVDWSVLKGLVGPEIEAFCSL